MSDTIAPNPTTIDQGTTSRAETVACDADATCVEFTFLGDKMGFARL